MGLGLLKELTECERVGLVGCFLGRAEGRMGSCICTSSSNMGRKVEENEMAGGGRFVTVCFPSKMPSIPKFDLAVVVEVIMDDAVCCP